MSGEGYCIRCESAPAGADGLCASCTWSIRAEIQEGLYQLGEYLRKWLAYERYCDDHGVAA